MIRPAENIERGFVAAIAYTKNISYAKQRDIIIRYVHLVDRAYLEGPLLRLLDEHLNEQKRLGIV